MKRITPEMVVEAYRKTGLRPIPRVWYDAENKCGCASTALAVAGGLPVEKVDGHLVIGFLCDQLEVSRRYVNEFVNGFDGRGSRWSDCSDGFLDGQTCWQAVKDGV